MTETIVLYAPGDYVYVRDVGGRLHIYVVRADGSVTLVQGPVGAL